MSVIISIVPIVISAIASASVAGGAVAAAVSDNVKSDSKNRAQNPTVVLHTNIRNKEMLYKALENLGAKNISELKGDVSSEIDNFRIIFYQNQDKTFDIEFYGDINKSDAEALKNDLIKEYGSVIQNHVYETLKRKAENKGLELEKEVVQNDQSIILTYNIK